MPQLPDRRRSHSEHQQGGRARRAECNRDQLTRLGIEPVRVAHERVVVVRRQTRQIVPRRSQHEQWERDADDEEVTGIVLRIWLLRSDLGALDADEAVWGTMARHVLDGEIGAFFWGQGYGGTHETLLTAGVFALTGASVEALRSVPLFLFAVCLL